MDTIIVSRILLLLQGQPDGGIGSLIGGFLPLILIFGVFYLLLIRPQQKRQRQAQMERDAMLNALKPNDKVITSGGIYGTITAVRDNTETVMLRIAQSVQIEVQRSAITGIQSGDSKDAEAMK